MEFGGPVWHASARATTWLKMQALAKAVLSGVGDPGLGEWHERGEAAYHIRRRLTPEEAAIVGPVRDIRGTPEEAERMAALLRDAPHLRGLL